MSDMYIHCIIKRYPHLKHFSFLSIKGNTIKIPGCDNPIFIEEQGSIGGVKLYFGIDAIAGIVVIPEEMVT